MMVCNNALNSDMESNAFSTFERFVYDYEEKRCDEVSLKLISLLI